jgi:hypothetical protein
MGPAYRLGSEQDIMYEIMESGPVQGIVQNLESFLSETANMFAVSGGCAFYVCEHKISATEPKYLQ